MRSSSSGSLSTHRLVGRRRRRWPRRVGFAAVVHLDPFEQRLQREGLDLPVEGAHVEARDVEQAVEQVLHGLGGDGDLLDEAAGVGGVGLLAELGDEQAEGVHGLAQVVAGGGEEAGLGAVAALGFFLFLEEFAGGGVDLALEVFPRGAELVGHVVDTLGEGAQGACPPSTGTRAVTVRPGRSCCTMPAMRRMGPEMPPLMRRARADAADQHGDRPSGRRCGADAGVLRACRESRLISTRASPRSLGAGGAAASSPAPPRKASSTFTPTPMMGSRKYSGMGRCLRSGGASSGADAVGEDVRCSGLVTATTRITSFSTTAWRW